MSPFEVIGLLTFSYVVYWVFSFIYLYAKPSQLHRYAHADADGRPAWALVTGASYGIGKSLSHELADRGFNVVLHGRNRDKLNGVKMELQKSFPARSFRVLVADASTLPCTACMAAADADSAEKGPSISIARIAASLSDLHLTVLINNAGAPGSPRHAPLETYPQSMILGQTNLNAMFPLLLTAALLPQLARSAPALVINIGSQADHCPPLLSFYAPAKMFVMGLATVLGREQDLAGRDVEVIGMRVGEVAGTTNREWAPSFFEPSTAVMARAVLARAGCGRRVVVGYWPHALRQVAVELMPVWWLEWFFRRYMSRLRDDELREAKAS